MRSIEFWYDFGSTYAYLSAMRISPLAEASGVTVIWRPFLLGPIFKAAGWPTSPFNVYPAKGRYMARDISRIAASRGLPFALPDPFPANGLTAARIALAFDDNADCARFSRHVFKAEFSGGGACDISDTSSLVQILHDARLPVSTLVAAREQAAKDRLRAQTSVAIDHQIFGAPFFLTKDGEPFWGDDRLEQALAHAVSLDAPTGE